MIMQDGDCDFSCFIRDLARGEALLDLEVEALALAALLII
jgi:hypothetical protein